jgi:hypothetical protein
VYHSCSFGTCVCVRESVCVYVAERRRAAVYLCMCATCSRREQVEEKLQRRMERQKLVARAWQSYADKVTGHMYYHNTITMVTQWDRPPCFDVPQQQAKCSQKSSLRLLTLSSPLWRGATREGGWGCIYTLPVHPPIPLRPPPSSSLRTLGATSLARTVTARDSG